MINLELVRRSNIIIKAFLRDGTSMIEELEFPDGDNSESIKEIMATLLDYGYELNINSYARYATGDYIREKWDCV